MASTSTVPLSMNRVALGIQRLRSRLMNVIHGKPEVIDDLITAVVAGGSVLLEDVPGVGKTTLAKALAAALDLEFQRVQSTPDLLPADVFGVSVFNPQDNSFQFRRGPIFCHLLLVDEINRASPRTQSALLEAMAEQQVTVEGARYALEQPFLVIATQNPSGFQGTFPLPESQLDRFLFCLSMDYPDAESEVAMLFDHAVTQPIDHVDVAMTRDQLVSCQQAVKQVRVERSVADYIVAIANYSRNPARFRLGCSPRGSLMLFRAAQARALVCERDYVIPDDVQRIAPLVLNHRLVPAGLVTAGDAQQQLDHVQRMLDEVPVPV